MYDYLNTTTNRELSKLLHDKGLVSESGYSYIIHHDKIEIADSTQMSDYFSDAVKFISPSYSFEDCIRRENAIILWEKPRNESINLLWSYQSGGDWQSYLINHLKGEHNV